MLEKRRQYSQGPWDPRNDKVASTLGFLFASCISENFKIPRESLGSLAKGPEKVWPGKTENL